MTTPAPNLDRPPRRILVVDADRRVRRDLADLLCLDSDLTVVGTSGKPTDALVLAIDAEPDVVLVDPELPEPESGLAFIEELRRLAPATSIVAMSSSAELRAAALRAGANAALDNECSASRFVEEIALAAAPGRTRVAGPSLDSSPATLHRTDSDAASNVPAAADARGMEEARDA